MAKIDAFFKLMNDQGALDLHLVAGQQPALRIRGEIERIKYKPLDNDELRSMVYEIAPGQNQSLLVTCNAKEVKTFPAGQFFLPQPLLIELAQVFLESQYDGVIVDVLTAKGQLVPVRLTKVTPAEANAKSEAVESVVRMDFIYLPDSYEELLFDRSQNLLGKFRQQPGRRGRIWEAVSPEALQQIFQEDFQAFDGIGTTNEHQ